MRLFLGLDLPVELKQMIHQYLLPLRLSPKGWESPLDYHLTLKFIGEVDEEAQEKIISLLREFTFTPFNLSLDDFHFFSRRIMYLGLRPSVSLDRLKNKVDKTFAEWASQQEKSFIPHITVKRWQRYEYEALKEGLLGHPFCSKDFFVDSLILFKSAKISPEQKYHVVEIKKL